MYRRKMARDSTATARVDRNRELRDLYRTHPLRKQSILKRIVHQKGTLAGITEIDLAEDPFTEITDQNHIGGVKFVRDLAQKAGVGPATDVLDLGCGLGGSARCLAYFLGCRVHGVDLSVERHREARQLTKLVNLDHLVTLQCGDVLRIALPRRRFDILWGQAAWVHIKDKERLIKKWSKSLKAGGRIALEEAYVRRRPRYTTERRDLDELADHWKSYLVSLGVWTQILSSESFEVYCKEDLSTELLKLCQKLIRLTRTRVMTGVSETEQKSWELTAKLVKKGIVGYFRLVAKKLK
jgi:SAM-dependent methyltransferase